MSRFAPFAAAYRFGAAHRVWFYGLTAVAVVATGLACLRVRLDENIETMLPDRDPGLRLDFQLLQRSPAARKLLIHVEREPGVSQEDLLAATDRLAAALTPPHFQRVMVGPGERFGAGFLAWLPGALPNLATAADLRELAAGLGPDPVRAQLEAARRTLTAPEGLALKDVVRADPLDYRALVFRKLSHLQLVPHARLVNGHFVNAAGRAALVLAETAIPLTDAARGRELVAAFDRAAARLPAGITATLVAGHRYTVANSDTIRRDLVRVFAASGLAMGLVFLVFMRHWRALFVFLVPVWVVFAATAAVGAGYPAVSAITLGFGAVLLGIADDFSTHVYFALRATRGEPAATVAHLTAPLLQCVLVTSGAFAVLLLSALPGQRQLGVLTVSGLVAALLIALLVLPHFIPPATTALPLARVPHWTPRRAVVIIVWLAVLGACLGCLPRLRFSGELRDLGVNVAALRAAEQRLADAWGDVRGRAMIFVPGPDLERALAANDRLFATLSARVPDAALVTLAPVLPARATQTANAERWRAHWAGGAAATLRDVLARESARAGFAPDAFAAFAAGLTQPPTPFGEAELRAAGLGEIMDALVSRDAAGVRVMTLAPDTPAVAAAVAALRAELPGVRLVSPVAFGAAVAKAVRHDFGRFLILAGLAVAVLLVVLFRGRWRHVLLALVPVVTGVVFMLGVMAAVGWPLNLFNLVASIMVIGLGVDYGIFMLHRLAGAADQVTERAVLVSALTTLTSFGALVLARHPALSSIGISVSLGILAAMVAALLVTPALWRAETHA